ncbi:MAG: hypothetical protein ACT4QD_16400 [Acidobacteriota bacterium]
METLGPTVLWRLFHPERGHARAVMLPGSPEVTLSFFLDDVMDRIENFEAMDLALFRSNDVKQSLMSDGWKEDA